MFKTLARVMPKLPRYKTLTALRYTRHMFKTLGRVMSKRLRYTISKYKTLTGLICDFFAFFLDTAIFSDSRARNWSFQAH
jgi:hypothetical protein